jgi:hypothetical protein
MISILTSSLQIAVPVGSLVLPVAGIIFCILFNLSFPKGKMPKLWWKSSQISLKFSSAIESLLIVVCSSHSTLNILLMAICTRPYREATKRLLLVPFRRLLPDSWMPTSSKAVPHMAKGPITRTAAVPLRIQRVTPVDTPADEWRVGQRKKSAVVMLGHRQAIGPRGWKYSPVFMFTYWNLHVLVILITYSASFLVFFKMDLQKTSIVIWLSLWCEMWSLMILSQIPI